MALLVATCAALACGQRPEDAQRIAALEAELAAAKTQAAEAQARIQALEKKPALPAKPAWVDKSAYKDDDGVAWAVGVARGIRNPSLLRSTCDNRARAAMARFVGEPTLNGVEIVDHWIAPDGTLHSLARLGQH